MTRIILARHGETTWNIEGRYQGQEDTPLSPKGIEQAEMLAEGLRHIHLDVCISSPLQRSCETCRRCAELHNLDVQTDSRLLEINHGAWEGVLAQEIAANYPEEFKMWHTAPHLLQMPQGESLNDVAERTCAAFADYAENYVGKTVLVVAHDAVNKAVICRLLGMSLEHFWHIKQDNTCINVLEYDKGVWRAVLLNSTAHLGFLFSGVEQAGL
ncbi:MAG: histidine phosphatase family protein [Acidaminococcaceae bacterium]|nr:histidine phosphatase family protein [Acidaminococcaceae bacterium]